MRLILSSFASAALALLASGAPTTVVTKDLPTRFAMYVVTAEPRANGLRIRYAPGKSSPVTLDAARLTRLGNLLIDINAAAYGPSADAVCKSTLTPPPPVAAKLTRTSPQQQRPHRARQRRQGGVPRLHGGRVAAARGHGRDAYDDRAVGAGREWGVAYCGCGGCCAAEWRQAVWRGEQCVCVLVGPVSVFELCGGGVQGCGTLRVRWGPRRAPGGGLRCLLGCGDVVGGFDCDHCSVNCGYVLLVSSVI